MDTKSELASLKEKLLHISSSYESTFNDVEVKEKKWKELEIRTKDLLNSYENQVIKLNIGGTIFYTTLNTLLKSKETLFHKLYVEENVDRSTELFIDRSPTTFPYILDFLRTDEVNTSILRRKELYNEFIREASYYGFSELIPKKGKIEELEFVDLKVSSFFNGSTQYGSTAQVLRDRNLNTAILTNNGLCYFIIYFNHEVEFSEMEIGGFTGDQSWNYPTGWGSGGSILTSLDLSNWTEVGKVPAGFGNTILKHKVKSSLAKYLKIEFNNTWIGIGYIGIIA